MRKTRNLIILALTLIVLIGGYLYLSKHPLNKEKEQEVIDEIKVLDIDKSKIKKVSIKSTNSELTIEKSGDNWNVKPATASKLDSYAIDNIASTISYITAETVLDDNPQNLVDYGLNPPKLTATISLDDGSQKIVKIGDTTADKASYYLMVDGDSKLYVVETRYGSVLATDLDALRDKMLYSIEDPSTITYFKVVDNGKTSFEAQFYAEPEEDTGFVLSSWRLLKPFNVPYYVNDEKFSPIMEAVVNASYEKVIDENPSDLSKYGLDKPSKDFYLKAPDNDIHISFGNKIDDSHYYVKFNNENIVYSFTNALYEVLNINAFDLLQRFAFIVNIDNVDAISVKAPNINHVMTLTRVKKVAASTDTSTTSTENKEEFDTTYKMDGKEMTEDDFKKMYQSLIGLLVDSPSDKKVDRNPEITFNYTLNKGDVKNVSVEFCPYNADFYAVFVNGNSEFLIAKSLVKGTIDSVEQYASKLK